MNMGQEDIPPPVRPPDGYVKSAMSANPEPRRDPDADRWDLIRWVTLLLGL